MKRDDIKSRLFHPEKKWVLATVMTVLILGVLLISAFISGSGSPLLCSLSSYNSAGSYNPTSIQLEAIIHYATSTIVPQQNFGEISISFNILKSKAPCNFLVFGLGHDSFMWASLNPRGKTVFLEEDPTWVQTVLKGAPFLEAHHVLYRTQLSEADHLLTAYKSEPSCFPAKAYLKGNEQCKLALTGFPDVVYETEWDLIMIDAPRGYFAEAPGRMGAIFSAAVMARKRKGSGVTHVFLHDVDRRVEKDFSEEFLCKKYRVNSSGRLWHFEIPPANLTTNGDDNNWRFC